MVVMLCCICLSDSCVCSLANPSHFLTMKSKQGANWTTLGHSWKSYGVSGYDSSIDCVPW